MGLLLTYVLLPGLVLAGLACIVHPPTAGRIAMLTLRLFLLLFAVDILFAYVWSSWIGRILLIASVAFALLRGREA